LKATRTRADLKDRELKELMQDQSANEGHHRTVSYGRRQADQERVERSDRGADLIRREKHFHFIKMHYLTDFASNIWRFGSRSMYSTEISELA